jgi:adenylate cyclase
MTGSVWAGYTRIEPQKTAVTNKLFKKIAVKIPGYTGDVYGGDVISPALRDK